MPELHDDQRKALDRLRAELHQGDVLHVEAFAVVGAPEATQLQDTQDAAEFSRYRLTAVERELAGGLWGVISQTCDIRRDVDVEPFLQISPVLHLPQAEWNAARDGLASTRRFAYPHPVADYQHPVLDVRIVQTIEKTAVVIDSVGPVDTGLDRATRLRLSAWLARRFARHAFPDEIEDAALRRLRDELKRADQPGTPAGALLACREVILVAYGDGPSIDVLFVVRRDRVVAHPVFANDAEIKLREGADSIMRPVAKRLQSKRGGYTLTWDVATPNQIPYADILYRYNPIDIALP
ncbi:MAG: hypothetical protein U0Q12_27765 [Vicinamibacterales bacterium]